MKTATMRDLRNHFADVARWIESGEEIIITRNGKDFATLSPTVSVAANGSLQEAWGRRKKQYTPVGRTLSQPATESFWSQLRD